MLLAELMRLQSFECQTSPSPADTASSQVTRQHSNVEKDRPQGGQLLFVAAERRVQLSHQLSATGPQISPATTYCEPREHVEADDQARLTTWHELENRTSHNQGEETRMKSCRSKLRSHRRVMLPVLCWYSMWTALPRQTGVFSAK